MRHGRSHRGVDGPCGTCVPVGLRHQLANYLDIFPSYATYAQNLQFYRDHKIKIVDMQGTYSAPWGEFFLRGYVLAKLLWNPDADWRFLTMEYLEGVYGPCAKTSWRIWTPASPWL